jgi:bifunctional non-homologous end joining protein LigD
VPLPVQAGKDTVLLEGVRLTHPNKVLFPEQGVTKLVLAQYHARVADRLLPYVADRPLTLVRCPEGPAKGPCFFQKHITESMPPHIFAVTVQERAKPAQFITIHDRLGLLALVQIGALELHPWGARNDALGKPDVLVFDLDPDPGLGWPRLVEAALLVQAHLHRFDLESFVRTTGGKGLHVVVPVAQELDWPETKRFCGLLAEAVVRSAPDRYTATMAKAKRAGKVFVDWFRNGEGATSVATWSPRARLNAPIAVPISWDELPTVGRGDRWHVADIEERLARPDPWADFHALRQRIPRAAFAELGG